MDVILYFGGTMLAAIPLTALLCRYRLARQKQLSWETVFAGASIAMFLGLVCVSKGECFTPDFWSGSHKDPPIFILFMLGVTTAVCALPAFGVVVYYQRRKKT